jgi:predicted PurR-regulated permease PerM
LAAPANNAGWSRTLLAGASIVLLVASLYWARAILIPFILAVLLTFILAPVVNAVQRRGLRRVPSVVLVLLLTLFLLGSVGSAIVMELQSLAEELPQRKDQIIQKIIELREASRSSWWDRAVTSVQEIADEAVQALSGADGARTDGALAVEVVSSRWSLLQSTASPVLGALASAGLVILLLTFMLVYREDLRNRMIGLLSNGNPTSVTRAVDDGARRLSRFLLVQLLVNVSAGVGLSVGLAVIGVPYAILWGFVLACMRYIPYVGAWIACPLPVAYSLAVLPGWTQTVLVVILVLALESVISNVIEPWVFGHSIGTSPVALLLAAVFWTWLWGPIGLLLAAPLTACLAVLGRHVPALRALSMLLGDQPPLQPHLIYYQRLFARDPDEAAELVETYLENHDVEAVYDDVILPALELTRRGSLHGELTEQDERFVYDSTRELLEEVVAAHRDARSPTNGNTEELEPSDVIVLGCPARDEADELALAMLEAFLDPRLCQLKRLSKDTLAGELVSRVQADPPAVLCIITLPPKGLTHTRYLCKRVSAVAPALKIVVGYLGLSAASAEQVRARLQAAGADHVAGTLAEVALQVQQRVRAQAHVSAHPAGAGVRRH